MSDLQISCRLCVEGGNHSSLKGKLCVDTGQKTITIHDKKGPVTINASDFSYMRMPQRATAVSHELLLKNGALQYLGKYVTKLVITMDTENSLKEVLSEFQRVIPTSRPNSRASTRTPMPVQMRPRGVVIEPVTSKHRTLESLSTSQSRTHSANDPDRKRPLSASVGPESEFAKWPSASSNTGLNKLLPAKLASERDRTPSGSSRRNNAISNNSKSSSSLRNSESASCARRSILLPEPVCTKDSKTPDRRAVDNRTLNNVLSTQERCGELNRSTFEAYPERKNCKTPDRRAADNRTPDNVVSTQDERSGKENRSTFEAYPEQNKVLDVESSDWDADEKVSADERHPYRQRGLPNIGNSCYMNASLQALVTVPAFVTAITALSDRLRLLKEEVDNSNRILPDTLHAKLRLIISLASVCGDISYRNFHSIFEKGGYNISRRKQKLNILRKRSARIDEAFASRDQQDAHEYITMLFDFFKEMTLISHNLTVEKLDIAVSDTSLNISTGDEDKEKRKRTNVESFAITTKTQMVCSACGRKVEHLDHSFDLQLSITSFAGGQKAPSIQYLIEDCLGGERMDDRRCDDCGHTGACLYRAIGQLPQTLVLCLKRYTSGNKCNEEVLVNRELYLKSCQEFSDRMRIVTESPFKTMHESQATPLGTPIRAESKTIVAVTPPRSTTRRVDNEPCSLSSKQVEELAGRGAVRVPLSPLQTSATGPSPMKAPVGDYSPMKVSTGVLTPTAGAYTPNGVNARRRLNLNSADTNKHNEKMEGIDDACVEIMDFSCSSEDVLLPSPPQGSETCGDSAERLSETAGGFIREEEDVVNSDTVFPTCDESRSKTVLRRELRGGALDCLDDREDDYQFTPSKRMKVDLIVEKEENDQLTNSSTAIEKEVNSFVAGTSNSQDLHMVNDIKETQQADNEKKNTTISFFPLNAGDVFELSALLQIQRSEHCYWGNVGESEEIWTENQPGSPRVRSVQADGNCLFRALSWWLTGGNENECGPIRNCIMNFVEMHSETFAPLLSNETDMKSHIRTMRNDTEWGTQVELSAMSTLLQRNIYTFTDKKWITYPPRLIINDDGFKKIDFLAAQETFKTKRGLYLTNRLFHFEPVVGWRSHCRRSSRFLYSSPIDRDTSEFAQDPSTSDFRPRRSPRKHHQSNDWMCTPGTASKSTNNMDFLETIEDERMPPYVWSEADGPVYSLTAVINHMGRKNSGHYTAFVFDDAVQSWIICDDDRITKISEKEVLRRSAGSGYVFIYQRRTRTNAHRFGQTTRITSSSTSIQ